MDQKFEIIETTAQPVLSIRKVTSVRQLPEELGKAYHAIIAYLEELGQQPADAAFACYYNMDMENLDVEMGFPVSSALPGRGEIKASQIPAGKKATALYVGPYQEIGPTYEAMTQWIKDSGEEPTGVAYEFYYNSPLEVPESELLTRVVFLLK
ncbi:MAG: GyrI-like domain-containing protein [Syntrophomonadaceae bacterium]|mgnify:FL=1|jgi:effector-binding domain-containing protein|nr:GyrI-like domain-containing protein [Syntrophomonadaceae bacterium]